MRSSNTETNSKVLFRKMHFREKLSFTSDLAKGALDKEGMVKYSKI